jgi:hypothetical protein
MRSALTLLASVVLGVTACTDSSPVVSGRTIDGRELSADQISIINVWLRDHRCRRGLFGATSPVPALVVVLSQSSGRTSSIQLFDKDGWRDAVIIEGRTEVCPSGELPRLQQQLIGDLRASQLKRQTP